MFDGPTTEFEHIALDHPSFEALSYILRHQELWPKGFKWYYGSCDRCAVGLAEALWRDHIYYPSTTDYYQRTLLLFKADELSPAIADIFYKLHIELDLAPRYITPNHVAEALDAYLAKTKESSHV